MSFLVGPSHAIRWNWHVRDGVVRSVLPAERIFGFGGAPIWSKRQFEKARQVADQGDKIAVMVGDFRFGNGIALGDTDTSDTNFYDNHMGIEARAITPELDRQMLARGLAALDLWHRQMGDGARYIFWCQFGRQVHDRMAGRHIEDGRYRHPTFNYSDIVAALPDLDIVDLAPLLRLPMHEVRRLYIDSSSHPSQIGYRFLDGVLFQGAETLDAFGRAVADVEADLIELARTLSRAAGRKVLMTGRSVWLDTLMTYLGATGAARLADAGLVLAPLDRGAGQPTIKEMMQGLAPEDCTPIIISAGGMDLSPLLAGAFTNGPGFWNRVAVVDWEGATDQVIRDRTETPRFSRLDTKRATVTDAIWPPLHAHMVEQGPLGMPSWTGLAHLLEFLRDVVANATSTGTKTTEAAKIEEDVLLAANGTAFLIGGNHAVLKFAIGELAPSRASLDAFADNIGVRKDLAGQCAIPFLHVIFPDKQSVMTESFPFQPVTRLGDLYLEHLEPALRRHVLYPADTLKGCTPPPFLPLDTHMTDHGSLAVLRMMLAAIKFDAGPMLDRIAGRISKPLRWAGDLGNKLTPPLYQDGMMLDPDWPNRHFRSPGGFNDGMIDIIVSPDAPINKTVLLFGDSFFRMMLPHLGAVFSKVVCLRTRFLHPEMLNLIRPDAVFSGNAERYLSNVTPDCEAHAFALYPQLRQEQIEKMDRDFLEAWCAVTAPNSARAKEFWKSQGLRPQQNKERLLIASPAETTERPMPLGSRIQECYLNSPALSIKHNTYFPVYETLFNSYVGKEIVFVEVGILNGGSLFMWRDFFGPKARIIGIDLNEGARKLEDHGFEIHIGSQSDPAFWKNFFDKVGPVDILLDDGGHTFAQQIITASRAISHIRDGGLLVVEDTHTSYMGEFGGPSGTSFISYAKDKIDGINHRFSKFMDMLPNEKDIWSATFFESIVAFAVNRELTGIKSRPTTNDKPSAGARDLRDDDDVVVSQSTLQKEFRYSS